MPYINAFRPVVPEKIFEDLSKFSLFCPLLGPFIWTNLNPHPPKHVSYQV